MNQRNIAIGHFFNEPFISACRPWVSRIGEVFFAWPGVLTCRPSPEYTDELCLRLGEDLLWCRENKIRLDVLFNCNCYGDIAVSDTLAEQVQATLEDMGTVGLFPDIVTTTSPFIAHIIRRFYPNLTIRASVNMRIHGTLGFEACFDLFDEFYISREHQRDFDYVKEVSTWADTHGKRLGMQVNSGCLRQCPFQTFHDNLHGHGRRRQSLAGEKWDFDIFKCRERLFRAPYQEDIIRATWIRPEDTYLWEPYIQTIKLSTRNTVYPAKILNAYASRRYNGNLLDLLDPIHTDVFMPNVIDNHAFPPNWATSGIGAACANNCRHCGRCTEVFNSVVRHR